MKEANNTGWPKKTGTIFLYELNLANINQFSKLFHCQNQEKICNNTITKDPTTPQVCRCTTLWNVSVLKATIENKTTSVTTQLNKLTTGNNVFIVSDIDRTIGQWRRRLECVLQQQGGHIEHLMQKLQHVTVTLDNNWDNKHWHFSR